jgi:hypothetical protein
MPWRKENKLRAGGQKESSVGPLVIPGMCKIEVG